MRGSLVYILSSTQGVTGGHDSAISSYLCGVGIYHLCCLFSPKTPSFSHILSWRNISVHEPHRIWKFENYHHICLYLALSADLLGVAKHSRWSEVCCMNVMTSFRSSPLWLPSLISSGGPIAEVVLRVRHRRIRINKHWYYSRTLYEIDYLSWKWFTSPHNVSTGTWQI